MRNFHKYQSEKLGDSFEDNIEIYLRDVMCDVD